MTSEQWISTFIDQKKNLFIKVSDKIWEFAETRFEEHQSAELLCHTLENEGFNVEKGVGNIETAFIGSFGSGYPIVGILGEFDALSGMSQKKGVAFEEPFVKNGNGHACGHNLLGTGALAAAVALKQYMEEHNLEGTIRYYGCPGEEGGSGKAFMAKAGLFDDVDFALCWHPWDVNGVMSINSLANYQVYFKFKGTSAHAAAAPHMGRSALDAVELMNIGVNYLREHIIQEARVHYAITNTGGISPNVVQPEAEVLYLIRAPKTSQVDDIYKRVCDIAKGAAMMTGTKVDIVFDKACSNVVPNQVLEDVMYERFLELGIPEYNEDERLLAKKVRETISHSFGEKSDLADKIEANEGTKMLYGSTDVGDVSWITPTVQCYTACFVTDSLPHTWQWTTLGSTSIGHKGMLHAGKVLAATAIEVMKNPQVIEKAKAELKDRLNGEEYVCPIPDGVIASAKK